MNDKEAVRARYDAAAAQADGDAATVRDLHKNPAPVMLYFRNRKIDAALDLARFPRGAQLLEVGCNLGQYTTLLVARGFRMTGSDLSAPTIEVASRNATLAGLAGVDYCQADVEDMPAIPNESFDGVLSFSTLRYVPNLRRALEEIRRVTKKGGTCVLDFPNRHCPWFTLLKNRFGVENHVSDHFYTARELAGLFQEAGFAQIETRKILFTHYTFRSTFLPLYKTVDWIGERVPGVKEMAAIILCKGTKA